MTFRSSLSWTCPAHDYHSGYLLGTQLERVFILLLHGATLAPTEIGHSANEAQALLPRFLSSRNTSSQHDRTSVFIQLLASILGLDLIF